MFEWISVAACANNVHHVSDVVNIAIGINLLFPVASSFLKCFLDGLEIDPEVIAEKYLGNLSATSGELEAIAVAAHAIEIERSRCSPLSWRWWLADLIAACIGMTILLAGWDACVGLWCLLLFLPVCLAIYRSVKKYRKLKKDFFNAIEKVKKQVATREESDSPYVKDYVKKCKGSIKKSGNGRKKSATTLNS